MIHSLLLNNRIFSTIVETNFLQLPIFLKKTILDKRSHLAIIVVLILTTIKNIQERNLIHTKVAFNSEITNIRIIVVKEEIDSIIIIRALKMSMAKIDLLLIQSPLE